MTSTAGAAAIPDVPVPDVPVPDVPVPDVPVPDVPAPDVRLVVVDMDGTLLDEHHEVPAPFWPLLSELLDRGVLFCPASGRQYATLARQFADVADDLVFVAENGSHVVRRGEEVSSSLLARDLVVRVIAAVRELAASGADVGAVLCGKRSAYVERADPAFLAEGCRYYALLETVDDLLAVDDEILKIAVFDFGSAAATTAPALVGFRGESQVVVSGEHWVDVMHPTTNKGVAVRAVQERYGVTPAQTVVFGDYLNDLEMLDTAERSYAMANAHPDVAARARYSAPANSDMGVLRVLSELLDVPLQVEAQTVAAASVRA